MNGVTSWILSKSYVDKSIEGISGVLAGKPCKIASSSKTDGVTTVVFEWTADNGDTRTTSIQVKDGETPTINSVAITGGHRLSFATTDPSQSIIFDVMDGTDGEDGVSVTNVEINASKHLIITLSNGNEIDAGELEFATEMNELSDVELDNPINGQILIYDSTLNAWKNGSPSATSTSLDDLSNVSINSATEGQILKYDETNQVWKNADDSVVVNLNDLTDVDISSLQNGQVIKYNSTTQKWENITLGTASMKNSTNAVTQSSTDLVESGAVYTALDDKVDKVTGKGLSENDYTDTDKAIVDNVTNDLAEKVDKIVGKGLSTNDYDNTAKDAVDALKSASTKDYTQYINPDNTDVPTSNAVYRAMTAMLDGAFKPAGNKTCAELTSELLIQANVGKVYKITDNGTTDSNWVDGAGQPITAGQMAVVVYGNESNTFLFNLENGINIDMSAYQTKAISPITVDGTQKNNVEDALDAINTLAGSNKTAIGNIKNGTDIDSFSDVENVLGDKVSKSSTAGLLKNDGTVDTTILENVSDNTSAINSIKDGTTIDSFGDVESVLETKADKVASATNGNLAGLDANGNLTDSGKSASDFGTADEIADIVNVYGSKNLMETTASSHTQNGITKTVNADGSFTLNGTATDNTYFYWTGPTTFPTENIQYTYSIETSAVWDVGQPAAIAGIDKRSETAYVGRYKSLFADGTTHIEGTFTGESGYYAWAWIFIPNGTQLTDVIVKGMIRLASVKDDTYVPYAPTNAKLNEEKMSYADNGVLGAKNLFNPNLSTIATSANYYPNISVTVGSDNQITVNSTSDTDGSYSYKNIVLANNDSFNLEKGIEYIISGLETDNNATYFALFRAFDSSNNEILSVVVGSTEASFTLPSNTATYTLLLCVGRTVSLSKTFKVMIRLATDTDATYQPYAMTNQRLTQDTTALLDNTEVNGAVNMLPNTATSQTIHGVTYTVNSDGSITVNGTATGGNASLVVNTTTYLKKGTYKLTGAPEGYNTITRLAINRGTPSSVFDNGNGATFTLTEDATNALYVQAIVWEGKTVNNLTFKPMITVASYNGDYVPYAKSNKELTEKIDIVGNLFTTTTKVVDNITHGIATTIATLENIPIGTYVVSGQFNSDSAMSGGGLVQFVSSGVIQNGASCNTMINQGFKANAGLTGIFNVTNATNQINLQIYTATADLTVSSARLAAIRIA